MIVHFNKQYYLRALIAIACTIVAVIVPIKANGDDKWSYLPSNAGSRQIRIAIAKGLLEDVYERMNAHIPNLKPSESAWLIKEEQEIMGILKTNDKGVMLHPEDFKTYTDRKTKFERSPEYSIDYIKKRLDSVMSCLKTLANKHSRLSLREEMALWAEIVHLLTLETNNIHNCFLSLKISNKIDVSAVPGLVLGSGDEDYWDKQVNYANQIQGRTVLEYLRGNIKK